MKNASFLKEFESKEQLLWVRTDSLDVKANILTIFLKHFSEIETEKSIHKLNDSTRQLLHGLDWPLYYFTLSSPRNFRRQKAIAADNAFEDEIIDGNFLSTKIFVGTAFSIRILCYVYEQMIINRKMEV